MRGHFWVLCLYATEKIQCFYRFHAVFNLIVCWPRIYLYLYRVVYLYSDSRTYYKYAEHFGKRARHHCNERFVPVNFHRVGSNENNF